LQEESWFIYANRNLPNAYNRACTPIAKALQNTQHSQRGLDYIMPGFFLVNYLEAVIHY
jgi:hypothetical protein